MVRVNVIVRKKEKKHCEILDLYSKVSSDADRKPHIYKNVFCFAISKFLKTERNKMWLLVQNEIFDQPTACNSLSIRQLFQLHSFSGSHFFHVEIEIDRMREAAGEYYLISLTPGY